VATCKALFELGFPYLELRELRRKELYNSLPVDPQIVFQPCIGIEETVANHVEVVEARPTSKKKKL